MENIESSEQQQQPTSTGGGVVTTAVSNQTTKIDEKKQKQTLQNQQQPKRWQANPALLETIVSLGFTPLAAEKALFYTGNSEADRAVSWLLDNPDVANDPTPLNRRPYGQ